MVGLGTGAPIVQVYHEKSIILPDVSRVLACLYEKDIKFETHTASYKSLLRLQASSQAPVPFYDGPTFLEESRGICRYIAEKYEHQGYPFLLGKDALERASVEQWLHNEEHAFNPPSRALYCHLAFPLDEEDGDDIDMHTRKLEEVLEVYEQRLSDNRFLAGNKFTLADLVHLPNSHYITASDKFVYLYDSRKNVSRWWDEISNRKSWQQVLRDMRRVEEHNRQEELKQQQQQQQKEHPRTSGHPIRIDSRKLIGTEPRTILVPPADTVSSPSIVRPHPTDTFPSDALVSSSQTTPTDKTSAVLSKETTVFNAPDEKPPTSVENTPSTSIKHPIPVQSIKDDAFPTTAKKPPEADTAKSSTKDASIPQPTVKGLHTRHKPSSSKDGSNNLDVIDYYPSHTDEETPYIEPTPRRNSDMLDAFSGSNITAGLTKTSSISAKEPDQPSVSDFYKSHSRATGIDSQNKESIPYSGRTAPKLEPADTSGSKLHTTDVNRRLQAEQWHTATAGLNDLPQDADHLMSTQQGKPSKDVKQYPSQDSEQATSHPDPEELTNMELVQRQENTTRRPYNDQRSQEIVKDKASSDQRSALLLPSAQEHDATPSWQEAIPYSGRTVPKLEPTETSGSKLYTTDAHRRLRAEQWHTATAKLNDLQQDADQLVSTQQEKPSKDVKQYPSQDSEQAISHPVSEEPMSMELVQRRENTTQRPYTDQRSRGIVEDKASSDQRSALLLPSVQEHDATPSWQEAAKDARGRIPWQAGYPGGQDTNKQPRDPASVPRQRAARDARGTFGESKAADSTVPSESFPDASGSSLPRQDLDAAHHTTAPFQKRYPGTEDTSKQAKDKISTPWPMADKDAEDTAEETQISDSSSSQLRPLYFQKADAPPWKQEKTEDHHIGTSAIQEKHANVKDTTGISRDIAFKPKQTIGQNDKDTFNETKSGGPSLLRDQQTDTWQAASTLSEQEVNQDGRSVAPPWQTGYPSSTPPSKTRYQIAKDASKQPTGAARTPKKKAAQDDKGTSEEPNTVDELASTEQPSSAWRAPISPRRQEVENSSRMNTSFQKRYPDDQDSMQVAHNASASQQIAPDGRKDIFEETKPADSTTSAKPVYTEQVAPPPRQAEAEDAQGKGRQSRVTIPEPQEMVARNAQVTHGERKTTSPGEQFSDRLQAIPQSRLAAAKDVQSATGETRKFPDTLDTTKKSRDTFEETKDPDSTLPRAQSLGAGGAQRTIGESRTPTSDLRKGVLRRLQPDAQDPFQQSKLSAIDQKDLGSLSSKERDSKDAQATMREEKSISAERQRGIIKIEPQGSIKVEKASSIYQKQPPVAQDNQEQAQITEAVEKANGSTPKHQQASDILYTFGAEEPYRKDTTTDQKLVPPLLSKEPTSQVQPSSESLQEAASRGNLSTKPSTIEQWQRASAPLDDATSSSGYDEIGMATIDQKLTPMSQKATPSSEGVIQMAKESGEQRVEPHVPVEAETSGVQSASPSFPGASTAHHATTDDKFSKQSIIDERVGEPTKMQASTSAHMAAPDGHSELVSIPDGQISEAAKPRHDQATLQEDVHDANLPILDVAKDAFTETKVADSTPSSAKPMYSQQPGHAEVEDTRDKGTNSRETAPDRQKMVERSTCTAGEQFSDRLKAIPPSKYREDTIDDQKVAPPPLSREVTSQVQPPSEPSHEAALHGDFSSKPSTIDQWRHASVPLHDVTSGSGDDKVTMSAVNQKPTPIGQLESDEQRVGPPVPVEAETSGAQRASPSFLGAPVDDHATIGDKFAKQSIIGERVGKPIQMQISSPDTYPASELTKRATPEGHETGDSDGQISEATKARDPATVHEDVNDVNLSTHDVGKDIFKETKVADSTPSNSKPMYTQQPAITPSRQTQVKEARDKSMQSRETIPEQQKMVEMKTGISGEQSSDYKKAIHPSRQVAAPEDAPNGDRMQFPYIPDSSKKSRVTFEEALGPGSTLPKAQALDPQDSQLTKGESTMPTSNQRKDWEDAKDDETIMTEEKSFSTGRLREMFQESESTAPKTQPTDSQDYSTVDKTFPVYQKEPLAAQIIQAGEKIDSSTPEHQESSGAPYTYDEKLSASAPARADIHDDHSADEPYKKYTADDQKVAPSLSSKEPASQVQPLAAPFERAVPDVDSPSKQFTIDQWQRVSAPLHGVSADSAPKQMHEQITAAHPASASTIRTTPDGHEAGGSKLVRTPEDQILEASKATQDPDTIHENVHDAAIDENTATYVHDRQAHPPASTQAQPTVETPRDYDSSQYKQKSTPSDKGSSRVAQPLSSVEPIKEDINVSATDYASAPQMIFRQQVRPSAPSTIGIPASDTQGVIWKIQEVTPDNRHTDDSEQVADASQAIPGQEEMTSPPGATVFSTSDARLASAEIQEVIPDDKQAVESIAPLFSNGNQSSHVESAFGPSEVGPPEKKFAPSDQELPHSAEQPNSGKPRKEQTVIPTAEQIKQQPTVIGQKDTPDTREALTSEDVLDTTPTHGDVHPTGSIEPDRRPLSIQGEETQEPRPRVAKDSLDTEDISPDALGNVQSLKPSTTPGALCITTGSTPGDVALAEQTSSTSGQDSADPAEPAFPLGPRNKEIRDSTPSGLLISSTDPSKRDAIVAVPDQAKDLQTTPSGQDILSTQRPSGKVQETIPGDDSSNNEPLRPSSAVREGEPSKVVPASVAGQDSAYPAQPPSSAEARSKEIGVLAPSAQLNATNETRNRDDIVAAPGQAEDSEPTPGQQVKLSAPSSYTQRPSGTLEEDEPADNPGEAKSSKPRSIAQEGKASTAVPVSAPDTQYGAAPNQVAVDEQKFALSGSQDSVHTTLPAPAPSTQYGTELHKAGDEQKFASSGQDSVRSVQPAFSTDEQTKEDTVVTATDQTSALEKIIDQKDTIPTPDKAKAPFSGTPDASRETQKSTDDDYIDEKHPDQGRISPYRHVSEPPEGPTPEVHSDVVIKETTLVSSQAETSKTRPDSTPISGDVLAASSLPETQDLQGFSYARNVPADSLQNIESPGHLSSDQALAPIMSPSVPSVAPLGTAPSTNSVQPPRKASMASTVDLESVPDTQHGIPRGEATPAEQKYAVSDQELPHTSELPSAAKTRKEEANASTGDQPNVPQSPETVRHQVKAPSSDARETLRKDQQPSGAVLPEQITHAVLPSDLRDRPTPEVGRTVVDKETTLLSSQAQTSAAEPDSTPFSGDVSPTGSLQNQDAQPPVATQAPATQSLQGSAPTHDDSLGKFESPRQASTDQVMAPVSDSVAPLDASQVTETGQDSAESIQPTFSSEPTKDVETATHQQAIAPPPDSAKTPFPGTQDALRKIQESTPDNGRINEPFPSQEHMLLGGSVAQLREGQITDPYGTNVNGKTDTSLSSQASSADSGSDLAPTHTDVHPSVEGTAGIYFAVPGAQKQLPAAAQDDSLDSSSKTKSIGQESMAPTRDLASSPDIQPDSSRTQHEAAPAGQKFAVSDQGFSSASKSPSFAEPRKEDTNGVTADQISVPQTTAAHKVPSATSDARESLWKDQESSRGGDYTSNSANKLVVSEGKASHAGHASEGPNSEVSSALVDKKMTLQSSQAQTSSTGPESMPISGDTHLSSADVPATSSLQNEEVPDVPTTPVPLGSASTQNIPDDSFHELVPGCGQSMHLDESFLVSHRFL
ncbi:microtubule-associated protein futsch-like isoform X6 [Panicum virgatum]|uniref:microtubule-associated protein futsch-like isoform X6 n=1 Tax=Panicum virgatum TaxID=38727 RepID=UPI0019D5B1BD|nr:microtubule-associated protein futsch-like isoform X6 [Panicum virgatum]